MIHVGQYTVLGNHPEQELPRISKVILDTNVASDLTDFYFGAKSPDKEALRELLLMFPKTAFGMHQVDISYHMAVQETFWPRDGELTNYRLCRARQLRHALSRIVEWTPQEVNERFASRRPPIDRDKSWPPPLPSESDRGRHPLPVLIVTYAHLLYMCHLYRTSRRWKHNNQGRAWPIRAMQQWAKDTFGSVGGYEIAMAITLFLDKGVPSGKVEKLLKLGDATDDPDSVADKAWAASWDMWFVRIADGASYGLLPTKQEVTFVITRDTDTKFVRSGNEVKMVTDNGRDSPVTAVGSTWSENLKEFAEIKDILDFDAIEAHWRNKRDPNALLEQAFVALHDLEVMMGVQQSTVSIYPIRGTPAITPRGRHAK